jgi:hypothetical protein
MVIFAVLAPADSPQLEAAMASAYENNYLKVGPGQYLVAGKSTAVDLSKELGISDGKNGAAIVLSTSSYFGRATNDIWEWMKLKVSTP